MDLLWVWRDTYNQDATLGTLWWVASKTKECDTLEDKYRQLEDGTVDKIYGFTAIPNGRYQIVIDYSPHFNRDMPHLLNVPQFDGIRIHYGNKSADTLGCILVGQRTGPDFVEHSVDIFNAFFPKLQSALAAATEPCYITVGINGLS